MSGVEQASLQGVSVQQPDSSRLSLSVRTNRTKGLVCLPVSQAVMRLGRGARGKGLFSKVCRFC